MTGYRIYRSSSATGPFLSLVETTTPATSYEDSGLLPDSKYYYEVSAFNADDESDRCGAVLGITNPLVPAIPAPSSAVHNGIADIGVSWTKTAYAHTYEIEIRAEGSPTWAKAGTAEADMSSWSTTKDGSGVGLKCGVVYYFRVRAVNRLGEAGPYSDDLDGWLMPRGFQPRDPYLLGESSLDDLASRSAVIGWPAATEGGVVGYRLFRAKLDIVNSRITRGVYEPLIDVSTNAWTQYFNSSHGEAFTEADKGSIYSYGLAAMDQYDNLGHRSAPVGEAGQGLSPLFTPHPIDIMVGKRDIALAPEEAKFGIVYGQNPVSYSLALTANQDTYIYLWHYDKLPTNRATISVMYADGSYFVNKYHPTDILKDKAANASLYSVDGYVISSDHDEVVTLELAVFGSQALISAGARFFVEATTRPPLKPN